MAAAARDLRHELVAALVAQGAIQSDWVRDSFAAVPREVFVPRFHHWTGERRVLVDGDDPDRRDEWLRGVYTDQALTVQLTGAPEVVDAAVGVPTSSSSMPTVMAGMLEALDLQPGDRVLEIGTGTGYNAALLSHRTGDGNVTSIELDPQLADAARTALAEIGLYPGVHVGDGAEGVPHSEPFERIIATAAIDHIPPAWIDQLAPGGVIVANVRGSLAGGVVRLERTDDGEVVGPFLEMLAAFMPMRTRLDSPDRDGEDWGAITYDMRNPQVGRTEIDPAVLADISCRFLLQLHLGGRKLRGFNPGRSGDAIVSGRATDGSWFDVDFAPVGAGYVVRQGGPQRLWDTVEAAHTAWQRLGRPMPDRFEVVADEYIQHVRYVDRGVELRWPLPL